MPMKTHTFRALPQNIGLRIGTGSDSDKVFKKISLIVGYLELLQKFNVFVMKGLLLMVVFLICNVSVYPVNLRVAV